MRKCLNCGSTDFIKIGDKYECACCGHIFEEPKKESDNKDKVKNLVDKLSKDMMDKSFYNDKALNDIALEIVSLDKDNLIANLVICFLARKNNPLKYKEYLNTMKSLNISKKDQKLIFPFIISKSEYKYLDDIESLLLSKNIYDDYSVTLIERKNTLEREEELYSIAPRDVFVCYSSKDLDTVKDIVESIEKDGYTTWYAERNLPKNSLDLFEYKDRIKDAISKCKVFLVVMSTNSMLSEDCKWELSNFSLRKSKNKIEYRIEDVENTSTFKCFFDGIEWIDASKNKQLDLLNSKINLLITNQDKEKSLVNLNDRLIEMFESDNYSEAFKLIDSLDAVPLNLDNLVYFYLSKSYHYGLGVEKNAEKASYYWALASKFDSSIRSIKDGKCFCLMGEECFKYKRRKEKDEESDFNILNDNCFSLFNKALNEGYLEAFTFLGLCCVYGIDTKKDIDQALFYLKQAASFNFKEGLFQLAKFYIENKEYEDSEKAFELFKKASELGHIDATVNVGFCYYYGFGCEINYEKAFEAFSKAAEHNNDKAQYNLAICYIKGKGVQQDSKIGNDYMMLAANNGNVNAQKYFNV